MKTSASSMPVVKHRIPTDEEREKIKEIKSIVESHLSAHFRKTEDMTNSCETLIPKSISDIYESYENYTDEEGYKWAYFQVSNLHMPYSGEVVICVARKSWYEIKVLNNDNTISRVEFDYDEFPRYY
jgi:hypothetical protein